MTASADLMVEHVANYLKKDPVDVKLANMYKTGQKNIKGETLMYIDFHAVYQSKTFFLSKLFHCLLELY